jgi:uncharacterized protein YbcI
MSVLSVTFHTIESQLQNWNDFVKTDLIKIIENLYDAEKYILSEVETEMLTEGKNTNLLIVFENQQKREEFLGTELVNISEIITRKFGENVMIFVTKLNPLQQKI